MLNILWMLVLVVAVFIVVLVIAAYLVISLSLWYKWRHVRKLSKSKGLALRLISDRQYHKRARPLPRGGRLYTSGTNLHVRYQIVVPQEVIEFLERRALKGQMQLR